MPNIGAPELIIILIMLVVPLLVVVLIVSGVLRAGRGRGLPPAMAGPGWLEDPTRRHQRRYWDGVRWTAAVSDDGAPSSDPV